MLTRDDTYVRSLIMCLFLNIKSRHCFPKLQECLFPLLPIFWILKFSLKQVIYFSLCFFQNSLFFAMLYSRVTVIGSVSFIRIPQKHSFSY